MKVITLRDVIVGLASFLTACGVIVAAVFTVLDARYFMAEAGQILQRSIDRQSVDVLQIQRGIYDRERSELSRLKARTPYEEDRLRWVSEQIRRLDQRILDAEKRANQ
jgi:hypothetical protein